MLAVVFVQFRSAFGSHERPPTRNAHTPSQINPPNTGSTVTGCCLFGVAHRVVIAGMRVPNPP